MSRRITLSLHSAAPGGRAYASTFLRNGRTDNSRKLRLPPRPSPSPPLSPQPPSPFYLCTRPSTPSTYDSSPFAGLDLRRTYTDMVSMVVERNPHFVFSPKLSKTLIKNNIPVPNYNLFQKQKIPKTPENTKSPQKSESECSSIPTSSDDTPDIFTSFVEIEDPFQRERGDTRTDDINSDDFSVSTERLTLYTDSSVEFNNSSFEGSHSSDLVPILSPCVCLSFSPSRSVVSSATSSHSSNSPSVVSSPSISFVRPPPVTTYCPRGRFYNPRFDPLHPLFEPDLLRRRAFSLSLPQAPEKDDTPSPIIPSGSPEPDSVMDTNPYSSYPIPGDWPDSDLEIEPSLGRVSWLKAITTPAV